MTDANAPLRAAVPARFGRFFEAADGRDFPFYDGRPAAISGARWAVIVLSCVAGLLVLFLTPTTSNVTSLLPRFLFAAIPMATFVWASRPWWRSIFHRPRPGEYLNMVVFWLLNLAVSVAVGALVRAIWGASPNPAADGLPPPDRWRSPPSTSARPSSSSARNSSRSCPFSPCCGCSPRRHTCPEKPPSSSPGWPQRSGSASPTCRPTNGTWPRPFWGSAWPGSSSPPPTSAPRTSSSPPVPTSSTTGPPSPSCSSPQAPQPDRTRRLGTHPQVRRPREKTDGWADPRQAIGPASCLVRARKRTSRPVSRILWLRTTGDHPSATAVAGGLRPRACDLPGRLARAALERRPRALVRKREPFLVLLRVGFAEPPQSPGVLVVSYTAVSPLPPSPAAVCSLWHCPAGHPGWALPTTLPCGVRTFLSLRCDHPADSSGLKGRPRNRPTGNAQMRRSSCMPNSGFTRGR